MYMELAVDMYHMLAHKFSPMYFINVWYTLEVRRLI